MSLKKWNNLSSHGYEKAEPTNDLNSSASPAKLVFHFQEKISIGFLCLSVNIPLNRDTEGVWTKVSELTYFGYFFIWSSPFLTLPA